MRLISGLFLCVVFGCAGVVTAPGTSPNLGSCEIFPSDNPWNKDISTEPVDALSANYLQTMNAGSKKLHPDFGANPEYGIPYAAVTSGQAKIPISFEYDNESDPGPYPIPPDAPIEGGADSNGDRHVLIIDTSECVLYETYRSFFQGSEWHADSGAKFDLRSNTLRPDGWTSADAAGLPIFPGLVRYDEVAKGEIRHAIRFTVQVTQRAYVSPATHFASSNTSQTAPPMGLRVRLKASYDLSRFGRIAKTILIAMQKYGMLVADNGSDWSFTGAPDARWSDVDLDELKSVPASEFEVVQSGTLHR